MKNRAFRLLLSRTTGPDGLLLNLTRLAALARVSRCHLSEVVDNQPGRGHQTRPKVAPLLTPELRALVRWSPTGDLLEHISHVEHSTPTPTPAKP